MRRRVVVAAFAVMSVAAAALLAITWRRHVLSAGLLQLGIYAVIVLGGVCRAFLQPSRTALSAQIVPRVLYPRAIAWRTGVFQLCAIVGPALGGLLYAWAGAGGAYIATIILLLAALLTMLGVRVPARATPPSRAPLLNSVAKGVRFLLADRILLGAITLDLFAVLFGGAVALLPVFAEDILKVGPEGFGLLRAAPAAGALVASGLLAVLPPLRRAGRALLLAVAGFGLGMIGFALSRSFVLSLLLLAAAGGLDMVSILVRSTLLQLRVPEHMLGRVSSVNQIFIGSSNEIGAFGSGAGRTPAGHGALGGPRRRHHLGGGGCAPDLRRLGPLVPPEPDPSVP